MKYGGKKSSIQRVQYGIFKDTMQIINLDYPNMPWKYSWGHLINFIDQCKQQYKIFMVRWIKPTIGRYILNTDGSCLQENGKIGGGGILRDNQGSIIFAFASPFAFGTNNIAKLKAALYGLEWCEQHGYKDIVLEIDSELLSKWISNTIQIPWICQQYAQHIHQITKKLHHFQCQHIYREANSTADFLAKWSHNIEIPQHFYNTRQLKGTIRGSYILEKMGIQNFRRRKVKRIKHTP